MGYSKKKAITGYRGLFMLFIVLFHTGGEFGHIGDSLINVLYKEGGNLGNAFFFMCSGYLITMHYAERIIRKDESAYGFIKKRITAIYPVYFITEVISIAIHVYRNGYRTITFQDILFDALLIRTGWIYDDGTYNAVGWFVCVLVICYILFYCSCIFSSNQNNSVRALVYVMLALVFVGLAIQNHPINLPFLYSHNGTGLSNFFVGGLIALLFGKREKNKGGLSIAATILLCLFFLAWFFFHIYLDYPDWLGRSHIVYTLFMLPLILMAMDIGIVRRIGEAFYPLGMISKYMCFLHMPVYLILRIILPSNFILGPQKTYILYWTILILLSAGSLGCNEFVLRMKRIRKGNLA